MHVDWPAVEYVPAGQLMHEDDPFVTVPARQLKHDSDPFLLVYVPAEQRLHGDRPVDE